MNRLGAIELSSDILTKANIGLWAFELDPGCEPRMYADEAMRKLIGLEQEAPPEETYHAWYDHIDAKHYDEVSEAVEKMTSGIHAEVQYPWHHPNGSTWVVRCGGVRNYAYTKGIRIEGTHQNVTAIAHFEKRNLSDLLASLADNFLQVYFLDPYTGAFDSYAGNAFEDDKGRDYSKVNFYQDVAERSGKIVHPEDKPVIDRMYSREALVSMLENGKECEFVIRWPNGDAGDCVYMKNRIVPFAEQDGSKKLVIGVSDVTAAVLAKKKIDDYNELVEGLSSEYHTVWRINGDTHRIRLIRSDGKKTLKAGLQMGLDQPIFDLSIPQYINYAVLEEDRERVLHDSSFEVIVEKTPDTGVYPITYRRYDSDGHIGFHQMCFAKVKTREGRTDYIYAFRDVDSAVKKQLEDKRMLEDALAKADDANKAKTAFLFNMSHDIRTPMNAILGFTGMAQKHLDDPERVEDCLSKVMSSGRHLLSLINDVLDMARIESGKMQIEEKVICLKEASRTAMAISAESAKARNIAIDYKISSPDDVYVYGDELKINQIALNILSNAVKYTNPGGSIHVRVDQLPCEDENLFAVCLTVQDNGIGMSREFLEKIFEPFERSTNSTQSGVQGTGLGMAITKELVENMGGEIRVESELGVGTTVTVILKLKRAERVRDAQHLQDESNADGIELKGKKILLVEDNLLNREIAQDVLTEEGMIVETAEDGDIAVEIMRGAQAGKYDLILMDIQMPRMNGYEATRAIRNLPDKAVAAIPIVAMTANAFEEDKKNALKAGMDGHIAKPIDVPKLLKTIGEICR